MNQHHKVNAISLIGKSGNEYFFYLRKLDHDFSKNKTFKSTPALFLITTTFIKDSLIKHNILHYGKIVDLSKFSILQKEKTELLKKGATNVCFFSRKKPNEVEKAESDLLITLKELTLK